MSSESIELPRIYRPDSRQVALRSSLLPPAHRLILTDSYEAEINQILLKRFRPKCSPIRRDLYPSSLARLVLFSLCILLACVTGLALFNLINVKYFAVIWSLWPSTPGHSVRSNELKSDFANFEAIAQQMLRNFSLEKLGENCAESVATVRDLYSCSIDWNPVRNHLTPVPIESIETIVNTTAYSLVELQFMGDNHLVISESRHRRKRYTIEIHFVHIDEIEEQSSDLILLLADVLILVNNLEKHFCYIRISKIPKSFC